MTDDLQAIVDLRAGARRGQWTGLLARRSFLDQRDLALVSPEGPVRRLMHIAGLDAVAPLYATLEQALIVGAGP